MKKMIYLDNSTTSFPKPESVYTFIDQFYRRSGVNPGRSGYDLCMEAGELLEATRKLLARFFNGRDPNRLCFCYNATDALNLIIFGMLQRGDHAITTTLEHNSVLRPLIQLSQHGGVQLDILPFDGAGFVDPDRIKAAFRPNTRLVIVNHGSNVIGTIQPIKDIGRYCRESGIPFAIDASQTAGHIPIDLQDAQVDVIAFTGHKSLMGPTGIGGLYVGDSVAIRQTRAGGTGIRSAEPFHPEDYPYHLEFGTPNILGAAGLNAGVTWIQEQSMASLAAREMKLTALLREGLRNIPSVILYCQDDLANHLPVLTFNIAGLEASDTGTLLNAEYNIACRTGLHCAPLVHKQLGTAQIKGSVRFGIGPFNTEDHIKRAVEAVADIADSGIGRPKPVRSAAAEHHSATD